MTYELHPLCTLFPRMAGSEFSALCDDIEANGLRQPIVLHGGMILDGGNRYRACVEVGVKPTFVEFDGGNLVSFVLSANLHRRHMKEGQTAAIVASAQDWAVAQTVGNPKFSQKCNVAPLDTVADRAAQSGASIRTQKMADKVAKKSPELAREVAHGEKSLPEALREIEPAKPAKETKASAEAKLSAKVDALIGQLEEANAAAADAGELAQNLKAVVDGDGAQRLIELQAELTAVKAVRDQLIRENAELKKQVKYLEKRLGK